MVVAFAPLKRPWRAVERFAEGRWATPSIVVAALAVHVGVSVVLPLQAGRDLSRYLLAYEQLFDAHVVYPQAILMRAPGASLVAGVMLEAGTVAVEVLVAALYVGSIVCWWLVARRFGGAAGLLTVVALLVYPGYVVLFHRLSSDMLFAAGFALLALLVARAMDKPTAARAAALGVGVAGLVLIRPVAQVVLLLVAVPLLAAPAWRGRLVGASAFLLAALVPLLGWAAHNQVRLDDFTVVRGGGASLPLFRAFVVDRIVEPENGPASRELARVVRTDLLTEEPYRSYEIDAEGFFSSGSFRMHEDLISLSDRTWGWDDDYRHLGRVGREAVLAHPTAYARGVLADLRDLLVWPLYVDDGLPNEAREDGRASGADAPPLFSEPRLPVPTEGEPIPASRMPAYLSTPDGRITVVWTSPESHSIGFRDPEDGARSAEIDRGVADLLRALPDRAARPDPVDKLNSASRWYPRPIVWLVIGLLAAFIRRPRGIGAPLFVAAAGLLVLVGTALTVYAVPDYAVPVVPAFIVLAGAAALGTRVRSVEAVEAPVRGGARAIPSGS